MKKIIYIDCDGTLKNDKGEISERTKKAINQFTQAGNYIVLCTGQPRYFAEKISKEIGCESFFISSNGSEIYNNIEGRIIKIISVDNADFIRIYEYAEKNDIRIVAVSTDKEFVTKEIRNKNQYMLPNNLIDLEIFLTHNKIKQIMLISSDNKKISRAKSELINKTDSITILNQSTNEKEPWVAFGNSKVSKGEAIKELTTYLGETINNTIAIGNGYNDISMFEVAGKSVAMENAENDIKNRVDIITASNNDDGVAIFLENILKEN